MNFNIFGRTGRLAAIGAILLSSASCIYVNEELGENLIPTDQEWDVFNPEAIDLTEIRLQMSDSLSGYNTSRFTFGAIHDGELGSSMKSTCFTLVPINETLDFGTDTKVRQFHFTAVRDTISTSLNDQARILQNVYVTELKKPLDSTVLYTGSFMDPKIRAEFLDLENRITEGIPVYDGGDSLSFDFSKEYTLEFIERLKTVPLDSMNLYLEKVPGIYISTDTPAGPGGRINMFNLPIRTSSGYVTGNYAELKFTAKYDSEEPVDTSFLFYFGPADFRSEDEIENMTFPTQFAFNTSEHETVKEYAGEGVLATDKLIVEGGSGVKPVIKAIGIKDIVEAELAKADITDPSQVVINKATIILPYDVNGDYEKLDRFPQILSPTVRLRSTTGGYVSYAGLTDSSISTENQGDINRSLSLYSPDISHHVQEILKLDRNAEDFDTKIEDYDIWFLIMHNEVEESTTDDSALSSLYNNLAYSSYYGSMYDPYGYGYGYGGYGGYGGYYGGYGGYGGYGYGSNYYNYLAMAAYASGYYSDSESTTSVELDKDRFYSCTLNGPESAGARPQLKFTFSAPKTAE
ncbi:MAG: hypothetical protein IJ394_05385 [Bacteroidales bacterium]|nr:hypothetical protein [Bacteroidales bacterium]